MSPWIHIAPVLAVALAGLTVGIAQGRVRDWWAAWFPARPQPEDPRVRTLVYEAKRFGSAYRHGLQVRRVDSGWWVGPRFVADETQARAEIRRVLGGAS